MQSKALSFLIAMALMANAAHAEFGVSAGASFHGRASFRSSADPQPWANNPGSATAGTDHSYDDGYNRVDSSGNFANQTTYWGYQNPAQDSGTAITLNSARTVIDASGADESPDSPQPALEVYWQRDLRETGRWRFGVRSALRLQQIDLEERTLLGTTLETVSDAYPYAGIPPGAPFAGSFAGPNFLLSDIPARTIAYADGPDIVARRSLEADLLALDLGPTVAYNVRDGVRIVGSVGGTLACTRSTFAYRDGVLTAGSDTDQALLAGFYIGADLQYRVGKRWGVFAGAAYTVLENVEQQVNGRSAEVEFGGRYTLRIGAFFQ